MDIKPGVGKIVYGLRKIAPSTVETEDRRQIHKPSSIFLDDCRTCAILDVVCEELESPCTFLLEKCKKPEGEKGCEECEELEECLDEKPCCWECPHLKECLDMAADLGADRHIKDVFGCDWEEFLIAVKMLTDEKSA